MCDCRVHSYVRVFFGLRFIRLTLLGQQCYRLTNGRLSGSLTCTLTLDFLKSPSSCLFSTSRDFVGRSAASRPKQRPLRGLTYSTLKFMRSTCGESSLTTATGNVTFLSRSHCACTTRCDLTLPWSWERENVAFQVVTKTWVLHVLVLIHLGESWRGKMGAGIWKKQFPGKWD